MRVHSLRSIIVPAAGSSAESGSVPAEALSAVGIIAPRPFPLPIPWPFPWPRA